MQEIMLDGHRLELPESATWSAVVHDVETNHLSPGRMILSVAIDGEELADYRESVSDEAFGESQRVEIQSVDISDYARQLVVQAPKHLEQVSLVLARSAALYRQKLPTDAAKSLHEALAGLDMLIQLLAAISAVFQVELKKLDESHAFDESALAAMRQTLESVVASQERGDNDALPDLLEKQLIPQLAPWGAFVGTLESKLGVQ